MQELKMRNVQMTSMRRDVGLQGRVRGTATRREGNKWRALPQRQQEGRYVKGKEELGKRGGFIRLRPQRVRQMCVGGSSTYPRTL